MSQKFSKEKILEKIVSILAEDFEIEKSKLVPEADLFEDLELDSIDAVDLAVRLQQFTNKKIKPEDFKNIRTLNDVVEAIYTLIEN